MGTFNEMLASGIIAKSRISISPKRILRKCDAFNPFVPNAPFLYPRNRNVFWCFQEVEKRCIGSEWVKLMHQFLKETLVESHLTHLFVIHVFSTPKKHQKTRRFSDVFRASRKCAERAKWVNMNSSTQISKNNYSPDLQWFLGKLGVINPSHPDPRLKKKTFRNPLVAFIKPYEVSQRSMRMKI